MATRREALGALILPALPGACAPRAIGGAVSRPPAPPIGRSPADLARDEGYWAEVARAFTIDRTAVNLNNAAISPSPAVVQEAMARQLARANSFPTADVLWGQDPPLREVVRRRLAARWGVDADEIAITRNGSEGLQICQMGFDLGRHAPRGERARDRRGADVPRRDRRRCQGGPAALPARHLGEPAAGDQARPAVHEPPVRPAAAQHRWGRARRRRWLRSDEAVGAPVGQAPDPARRDGARRVPRSAGIAEHLHDAR